MNAIYHAVQGYIGPRPMRRNWLGSFGMFLIVPLFSCSLIQIFSAPGVGDVSVNTASSSGMLKVKVSKELTSSAVYFVCFRPTYILSASMLSRYLCACWVS